MISLVHRRRIQDSPCWRCWHDHSGGPAPMCGVWLAEWLLTGASFWRCDCPEWVAAPKANRCRCGKVGSFPKWLNGERGCSAECAAVAGRVA